jgi:hypothetical protein
MGMSEATAAVLVVARPRPHVHLGVGGVTRCGDAPTIAASER